MFFRRGGPIFSSGNSAQAVNRGPTFTVFPGSMAPIIITRMGGISLGVTSTAGSPGVTRSFRPLGDSYRAPRHPGATRTLWLPDRRALFVLFLAGAESRGLIAIDARSRSVRLLCVRYFQGRTLVACVPLIDACLRESGTSLGVQ